MSGLRKKGRNEHEEKGGNNHSEKKILIVESPTKSRKITSFLGKGWRVLATFGHIRDLPQKSMGFSFSDILAGEPKISWAILKKNVVSYLKKQVEGAKEVIIATDPDREGEAIGWHVASVLKIAKPKRAVFHEITKKSIYDALSSPRDIDMNLVMAQITRRVIDRLVGYTLSPVFWRIRKNSSAGRVQSAALHLIVKRWKEIKNFVKKPYYIVFLDLGFAKALLYERTDDEKIRPKHFYSEDEIKKIIALNNLDISGFVKKVEAKSPPSPYKTSTLLQDAKNLLGFSSDFTMKIAQELFERGFITYHRTDSISLSDEGYRIAGDFLISHQDVAQVGRHWKTRVANAQEAHEAIRLTDDGMRRFSELFKEINLQEIKKLKLNPYDKLLILIGLRFISSQCKNALFDTIEVLFISKDLPKNTFFRLKVSKLKFEGFLRFWRRGEISEDTVSSEYEDEFIYSKALSFEFEKRIILNKDKPPFISYRKEYTSPPPLYTEATLIKEMEKLGIGRPSTYSTIIKTLKMRGYVMDEKGKLIPTPDGIFQDEVLEENFPRVSSPAFTAEMEEELDKIARGEVSWKKALASMSKIYLEGFEDFKRNFENKIGNIKLPEPAEKKSNMN